MVQRKPIGDDEKVTNAVNEIKEDLSDSLITYKIDDSLKSPGFKFAEAEVKGYPVRIEIGKRDLENDVVTIVRRDTLEKQQVTVNEVIIKVNELLVNIQNDMYNRALERRNSQIFEAHNLEEVEKIMNTQPGFVKAMWCGCEECELKMKEIKGTKSRCILENAEPIDKKCVVCGKEAKELVVWGIQY